jgi:Histidine kinase-, DNA gyrase B-, and HSP90-like ATPase
MTKSIIKTIEVQAGVSPSYLEDTMTTDISVLESIFDLIDNSIDAARDHLFQQKYDNDKYGLPKDYSGYSISIRLGERSISILDNCLGMEETTLTQKAFKTADTSNHKYGIGHYGLGLKRALLKFGTRYAMSSDNGEIAFKMQFDNKMISGNERLVANAYESTKRRKTLFVVTEIKTNIAYEIQSKPWLDNAVKKLKIRYAIYAAKGLRIGISSSMHKERVTINGCLPSIRGDAKLFPTSKAFKSEGVDVFIDSGIHGEYYFPIERNYSLPKNKTLTDDFGLYFICNDRVIEASSTASEHGWKTKWHSEYNGFVCIVRFVSEDSSKMPWNTLKTALKTDSRLFVQVRGELQPIADKYRQTVKKLYPTAASKNANQEKQEVSVKSPNAKTPNSDVKTKSVDTATTNPKLSAENNPQLHVNTWKTLLPSQFPISTTDSVLSAVIIEAAALDCDSFSHTSAMLLRSILESGLRNYVQKSGNFQNVKEHFYSSAEGIKKNHTPEFKAAQGLESSMMLAWLRDDKIATTVFGAERKKTLLLATKKAADAAQILNGVVHCLKLIDAGQIRTIRNDIYPLLQFLVGTAAT